MRHIHLSARLRMKTFVEHIADHANNLSCLCSRKRHDQAFPQWILTREETPGHRFIDHDHRRRPGPVVLCEEAALLEGNTQRIRVFAGYLCIKSRRLTSLRRCGPAENCKRGVLVETDDRRRCDYGGSFDSRKIPDLF